MEKETKETVISPKKPKLHWIYVLYWVFAFFCFLSVGADFLTSYLNPPRSSYLFIIAYIGMPWRLCSVLFLFIGILCIGRLFFLRKKNIFYKKWFKTALLVFLILLIFMGQRHYEHEAMSCIDCFPGGG